MRTTYSNSKNPRTPREILMDVIENWKLWMIFDSARGRYRSGEIGSPIRRLASHDQEILKNLKSEDLQNIRWPDQEFILPKTQGTKVFRLPHS